MERNHTGTVLKELLSMGRTHFGVVREGPNPVGGTLEQERSVMKQKQRLGVRYMYSWQSPFPILCCLQEDEVIEGNKKVGPGDKGVREKAVLVWICFFLSYCIFNWQ